MLRISLTAALAAILLSAESCIPDKNSPEKCINSSSSSIEKVGQNSLKSKNSIYIKNLGGIKEIEKFIRNISKKENLKVVDVEKKNDNIYFVWFTERDKPLKYLTYILVFDNQPYLAIGTLFDRNGENITEKIIVAKNSSYIEKMKRDIISQRTAFLASNEDKFIHIKGEGASGKYYLFIDPSCPFCVKLEDKGVIETIKNRVKDLYIVPTPLYSIHPDAVDRVVWLKEKYKNGETGLLYLYQSSHKPIKEIRNELKNIADLDSKRDEVKRSSDYFLTSALVKGTPTLINENGEKIDLSIFKTE